MIRRSVVLALMAVILLSAMAWAADEQLVYTGDYVSVGSTTKLCADALAADTDDMVGVPGVGLWFQAWSLAGIPRLFGPSDTLLTNSLGRACTLKTLNTGLYTVEAFGATDDFDGVSSFPVVVGSLTPRSGSVGGATAGIGYNQTPSGPRDISLGLLLLLPKSWVTVTGLPEGGRSIVSRVPYSPLIQFLLLDPDNPDGPTRMVLARNSTFSINIQSVPAMSSTFWTGFGDVQIGDSLRRAYITVEILIESGRAKPAPNTPNDFVVTGTGAFEVQATALSGQILYRAEGTFSGQTGFFFTTLL